VSINPEGAALSPAVPATVGCNGKEVPVMVSLIGLEIGLEISRLEISLCD
jgi:hypothetical protein